MRKKIIDHLGRTVEYKFPPERIITLCPGITDTLYSLQLEKEIIGRTRYCVHPSDAVQQATIVGGTKEIKLSVIKELKPDLLIVEKEENTKEIVEALEKEFPVYVAEVQSIQESYKMIQDLGDVTNRIFESKSLVEKIQAKFRTLPQFHGKRVAYMIWRKPYMVVGKDTYINSLLEEMGLYNPFTLFEGRYPAVRVEDLQHAELDYLFLATEPFPFQEKHKEEFTKFLPSVKSVIVDGEMFWYGPRMLHAPEYLNDVCKEM